MTTPVPVIGSAGLKNIQTTSITLPALTIANNVPVNIAVPPASPVATTPTLSVNNNISTSFDNPGMPPFQTPVFFQQQQNDAIRSAAQNTASAYGLNPTMSGDTAVTYNTNLFLQLLLSMPNPQQFNSVEQVLIPN